MAEQVPVDFLIKWNLYAKYVGFSLGVIGICVLLLYHLRFAAISTPKQKYEFVCLSEAKYFWIGLSISLAGFLFLINTIFADSNWFWFLSRIILSIALIVSLSVFLGSYFRYYHPFRIEKKLKKLRYETLRISSQGRPMKLLSEEEEDEYLEKGMQAEEELYTVDYDVWIDEVSGEIHTERYDGKLHAEKCPECEYLTLKVVHEKVTKEPAEKESGEIIKHYACKYCGAEHNKSFPLRKRGTPA
ncbi:MAG: hypothetical protein OXB93_01205 [Cytophagales bacterium]|nr:hypothetical protein [Cytophagales bacterium]